MEKEKYDNKIHTSLRIISRLSTSRSISFEIPSGLASMISWISRVLLANRTVSSRTVGQRTWKSYSCNICTITDNENMAVNWNWIADNLTAIGHHIHLTVASPNTWQKRLSHHYSQLTTQLLLNDEVLLTPETTISSTFNNFLLKCPSSSVQAWLK